MVPLANELPGKPTLPMFKVDSDPLPMHSDMFKTIGEIVVFWSRIENSIESDARAMMRYPIVGKLGSAVPHPFKQRLDFWRRCVRTLYPSIETYQSYADGFIEAVEKVAKVRNHIIHGTWTIEPNEHGQYLVVNYRKVRGNEVTDTLLVSQPLLDDLLTDCRTLDAHITGFIVTKMVHAHHGILKLLPPSDDNSNSQSQGREPD